MASKTKRRDAGAGALFQDSRGLWTARVELPAGPGGKRRTKVVRSMSKDVAIEKLKKLNADLGRFGDLPTSSPTVATWMPAWLAQVAPSLKPRTLETYRGYSERYIAPTLGKIRLERLTPSHVYALRDKITARPPEGLGLSTTTALQAHRILTKALRDAGRAGLVTKNVADKAHTDAPRRALAVRPALTADEARTLLLSVASDEALAVHWSIALLAGVRQGERLGITREMVDLDRGVLTVAWQLQRFTWRHGCGQHTPEGWPCHKKQGGACPDRHVEIPPDQEARAVYGGLWLTRPKSRAGWREVPIVGPLGAVLTRHLALAEPGDEGLILHRGDGHPIDPRDDSAAWDASLRAAGVRDVPLHSARHTTSTLLADLGVPEQIRMDILGHSSATATRGYTHVTDPQARAAMEGLGKLLAVTVS